MDLLAGKLGRIFRASPVEARGHQIGQLPGLGLDLAAAPPPGCGSTINFPATTAKIGATTTSTTMNPAAVIPTMPVRVTASAMTPAVGIPVVEIRVVEISSRKADGDVLQKSDARGSIPRTARDGICFFLMTKISENPVASPSSETGPLPFAGEQEVTSKKVIRPWGRGGVEVRTHLDQRHHTAEDRSWGAAAATRCCPARTGTGPCRAFRNPASRSRAGCKRFTLDTLGAVPSSAIHRSAKCESDDPNHHE